MRFNITLNITEQTPLYFFILFFLLNESELTLKRHIHTAQDEGSNIKLT